MLADLDSLEKRVDALEKRIRGQDKEAKETLDLVNRSLALLREGKPARLVERKPEEEKLFHSLGLLTSMPVLYVCNVDEAAAATGNDYSRAVEKRAAEEGALSVVISAKIEAEIAVLPREEREHFLADIGLKEPGLDRLIRAGYALLHLVTFFTAGPKEARAWTVTKGARAPQAAGAIHTDFERGFIRAETIAYDDYVDDRRRGRRARGRQAAARRQGIRGRRRRRDAFPVCDVGLAVARMERSEIRGSTVAAQSILFGGRDELCHRCLQRLRAADQLR